MVGVLTEQEQGGAPGALDPSRGRQASLIANALTMFGGQIAIKAISFIFNIIVIRHLGSEEYGKFAICAAFGGLFTVLSDLGLAQLAVKRIARDRTPATIAELASNIVAIRLLLAGAVVALTTLLAWLGGYSGELRWGIGLASLGLLAYALFGTADTLALGLERFRTSALLNVGLQLSTLLLSGVFIFGGAGFFGLLAANILAPLIVGLIGLRRFDRESPLRAPLIHRGWPLLLRSAAPFAAITLALSVSYKADAVILSFAVPTALIGAYTVAYNLIFTVITLSHSINLTLFPAMTRAQAATPDGALPLFRRGLHYLVFISVPAALFISLNAAAIVTLLYGPSFAAAAVPLALLAWTIPLLFLSEFLGYIAIVVDRERLAARANWLSAIGNVGANLALIPFFGIVAAAAITILTELLLVGQYLVALRQYRLGAANRRALVGTAGAATALTLTLIALRPLHLPVPLLGVVGAACYCLAGLATGAIGRAEVNFVCGRLRNRGR